MNPSASQTDIKHEYMPTINTLVVDDGDVSGTTISSIYSQENDEDRGNMLPLPRTTIAASEDELSYISNEFYSTTVFPTDAIFTDSITSWPIVSHQKASTPSSTSPTVFKV